MACCNDCNKGRATCGGGTQARNLRGLPTRPVGGLGLWDPRVSRQVWPEPNRSPNRPYILGVGAAPRAVAGLGLWESRVPRQSWPELPQSPDHPYIRGFGPNTQLELWGTLPNGVSPTSGLGRTPTALGSAETPPGFWDGVQRLINEMRQHGHRWTCQAIQFMHRLALKNLEIWQVADAAARPPASPQVRATNIYIRNRADALRAELRQVVDALTWLDVYVFNGDRCDAASMSGLGRVGGLGMEPITTITAWLVAGLVAILVVGGIGLYKTKRDADTQDLKVAVCRENPRAPGCSELISAPPSASAWDAVTGLTKAVPWVVGGWLALQAFGAYKASRPKAVAA